jgi:hypothetical protein
MAAQQAAGAGLSFAGNLVGGLAGAKAARAQNRILAQGMHQQNRAGQEAAGVTADFISQMRALRPNPGVEQGAFRGALTGPAIGGPGGAQFRADAAAANAGAQRYGGDLSALFARIRAPQLQRQQEAEWAMNAGNLLRPINMKAQDDAFLTQLRAGMKQPNPWAQLVGGGLSAAGQYMMSGG